MKRKGYIHGLISFSMAIVLSACGSSSRNDQTDRNDTDTASDTNTTQHETNQTVRDSVAPILHLNGAAVIYHQKKRSYSDPGATATDETDGDITARIHVDNSVDVDAAGDYTVTYTVTDTAGNAATPITRRVHVVHSIIKQTGQRESFDASGAQSTAVRDDGFYRSGVASDYVRDAATRIVRDRITGLEWQDGRLAVLSYDAAIAHCESLTFGGYDDWRLPNIRELMNITRHAGDAIPAIFAEDNTTLNHWSRTEYRADTAKAWGVSMNAGTDSIMPKAQQKLVRCVRGDSSTQQPLQRDDTARIVYDPNTGLEWQDNTHPAVKNWTEALNYCAALPLEGGRWRVPSYNELYMLLDRTRDYALGTVFREHIPLGGYFWTSTTYKGKTTDALIIAADSGTDKWYSKNVNEYVRCVRTRGWDPAADAIARIDRYAQTDGSSPAPDLRTYQMAGITGVTPDNLDTVNQHIAAADHAATAAAIQQIVNDILATDIPMPTLSAAPVDKHSGWIKISVTNIDTARLSRCKVYQNTHNSLNGKVKIDDFTPAQATHHHTQTSLIGCHTYYYWIEACETIDGNEICRIDTTPVPAKTVPDAPTDLKAYATVIRSLNLQWENNPDGCTVKYHLFNRTTQNGSFTQIPEINDLTSGTVGATATNVNGGVYIHYRVQAEDDRGLKSSLSCSVAAGFPQYGVASETDPCRAAVGYTWGDQPRYPWASWDGYTDKVIFTWDDVPLILNTNGSVNTYANAYEVRFRVPGGTWSQTYPVSNPFDSNGYQYQAFTVNASSDVKVDLEVRTKYYYDNNGDGSPELTLSDPVIVHGKTAASSGSISSLGLPPTATASTYYPGKIMVGWTSNSNADYYILYGQQTSGTCPSDSSGLNGYHVLLNHATQTTYDHPVSWQKWCYRVKACNANGCTAPGPHAYGNATGI